MIKHDIAAIYAENERLRAELEALKEKTANLTQRLVAADSEVIRLRGMLNNWDYQRDK